MAIYTIECATSHPQGIAEKGDIFYVNVTLFKYSSPLFGEKISYVINRGWHRELEHGTIEINPGKNFVAIPLDSDGVFQCNFTYTPPNSTEPLTCGAGVVVNMENFRLSLPKPSDYDQFWQEQLELLRQVPLETKISWQNCDYNLLRGDVTAQSTHQSTLHAELLMPQNSQVKSHPAVIEFQGAGVRGTGFARGSMRALNGFINLEVLAHDVPIDQSPDYYNNLLSDKFFNYRLWGLTGENPKDCYFVEIFLRAKRAVEIIKSLPQWDGKNIIVIGGSQGGWQALAAAALDNNVSGAVLWMCAGCNIIDGNWPCNESREIEKPKESQYRNILPYIDSGYFMENLNIPIAFHTGLCDKCCYCDGQIAAYNNSKSPDKKLYTYSQMGHEENTVMINNIAECISNMVK